jgi:hypothetical protein
VLEICGPYTGETFPEGVRARLHGLTFRPYRSVDESTAALDQARVTHKQPFGNVQEGARFVVLDDPALTSTTLAVSIMQVGDRARELTEQEIARNALAARQGGPLGLISVKEIRVAYPDDRSLASWRQFLSTDDPGAAADPDIRFVKGAQGAVIALVIRVTSPSKAAAFLNSIGSERILTAGVKFLCTE